MSVYNELVTVNDLNNVSQIFTELKKMNKNAMMDSEKLHNLFMVRYGDRNVNLAIINLTPFQIADLLTFEYGEKWEILSTEIWVGFNLGAKQVNKKTETITKTENREVLKDDVNKVSAYDTDELIVNDGNTSNTTDGLTGNESRVTTDEIIDMETVYNNLANSQKNSIIESVLNDVKNFITLSIY